MHTHMHSHTHSHKHTHTHIHKHSHVQVYLHMTYSQKCANMHLLVYLYTLTQLFLPLDCCTVYVLEHIDTQDHKQTDTLMHTHTHYTHIHIQTDRQTERVCLLLLIITSRSKQLKPFSGQNFPLSVRIIVFSGRTCLCVPA